MRSGVSVLQRKENALIVLVLGMITSFLSGIEEDFGYIIYTTSNTIKLDIEERIKSAIAKDSYSCFKLHPL